MTTMVTDHPWSESALYLKAKLYVEKMEESDPESWLHGFWSSLSLELLIRAALARINPVLLAEIRNDWQHVAYAIGKLDPRTPKSAGTAEVVKRLNTLHRPFNKEIADFCIVHTRRRNAELHTGELAFENVGSGEWLAKYYQACEILLDSMDKKLRDFFVDDRSAQRLVASLGEEAADSVKKDIAKFKKKWFKLEKKVRDPLVRRAKRWATSDRGHRVNCPSCSTVALVRGFRYGSVSREVGDELVVEKQQMLPSQFMCKACGLTITGIAKLSACNLGDLYVHTRMATIAEYYELYTEEDLEEALNEFPDWGYEDYFNE